MQTCGDSWQGDSRPWGEASLSPQKGRKEMVLRANQKVSAGAGLVSTGYFLASKPQVAGLGWQHPGLLSVSPATAEN